MAGFSAANRNRMGCVVTPITTPAVKGLLCRGAPVQDTGGFFGVLVSEPWEEADGTQIVSVGGGLASGLRQTKDLSLDLLDPVGLDIALRYLHQQGKPLEWARYLPLEVAAQLVQGHLALIAAGGEGIRGLLWAWYQHDTNCSARSGISQPDSRPDPRAYCLDTPSKVTGRGWWVSGITKPLWGPETGAEGRAACDAALLAAGIALLDGGTVWVPTPPAHQPA